MTVQEFQGYLSIATVALGLLLALAFLHLEYVRDRRSRRYRRRARL